MFQTYITQSHIHPDTVSNWAFNWFNDNNPKYDKRLIATQVVYDVESDKWFGVVVYKIVK